MEVVKNLVTPDKYHIKCPYNMEAEGYCVHNTANDASARNEVAYMIRNDLQTSYHYAIDDKEVVQGISEDRNGWHAGDGANGRGNRKYIGIEICYSLSGGDRFIAAEKRAAKFIAEGLKAKGWGIDCVKKHQDFDKKYCPHRTLDMGWQRFLSMIKAEMYIPGELSGADIPRGTDDLVLYFKGLSRNGRTGTNQWGYEVAIDKNGVVLEDPHYSGNTKIPDGGKVLSGHGKAGAWIKANIKKGYHVWFDVSAHITKGIHRSVSHFNGIRGADELVIYNKGSASNTNMWGWEVAVNAKGHVTKKRYGGKTPIPDGGFVLSGHGEAASWINKNVKVGDTVKLVGNVIRIT
ncbi:MAG: N-acetylmuramoyl-L-alanine amidase [Clostridia bacterium]|nr:N-acetylmuramoyl-L-alanine amidase [Clostridia bacterium]